MASRTPRKRTSTSPNLSSLLPSWELALRHERKSTETRRSYTTGVYQFLDWCEANGHTPTRSTRIWSARSSPTSWPMASARRRRARQLGVRRFAAWCEEEGEIDSDPLLGLRAPQLDRKVVKSLTDDELARLIKSCAGKDLLDRRDEAIVRLMAETGIRARRGSPFRRTPSVPSERL